MSNGVRVIAGSILGALILTAAHSAEDIDNLLHRLLAAPKIQAQAGFTSKLLVLPGQLYDPINMRSRNGVIWLNDDGPENGDKGGRLLAVDMKGRVTALADIGKLLPPTGFDIAPAGFGAFEGQVFALSQPKVKMAGAMANHIIQRIDPNAGFAESTFCTLPTAGTQNQGIAGYGTDAVFGPESGPFAGKFFAVTALNNTVYQVTADGKCSPFITFDEKSFGTPLGITFTPDRKRMLVSVIRGGLQMPQGSAVVRVAPDGKVDGAPLIVTDRALLGLAFAPPDFGPYGGQLFVTDTGAFQIPVPMTQALAPDGNVFRVTPQGELKLVASGFINPISLLFVGKRLWVSDINGDFIGGMRELPDGFIVELGLN
jgi:hypothetical protein